MINKNIVFILSFIIFGFFTHTVYAESIRGLVTLVHPVYDNYISKTPYQHCYTKQVPTSYRRTSNTTPAITGGIIGGVIGNQFGKGDGKTILTVAGVLLGSSIGSDLSYSDNSYTKSIRQCETLYNERMDRRIRGYNIGVTIPNGNVISTFKSEPYNPPRIHSYIDLHISYNVGNN